MLIFAYMRDCALFGGGGGMCVFIHTFAFITVQALLLHARRLRPEQEAAERALDGHRDRCVRLYPPPRPHLHRTNQPPPSLSLSPPRKPTRPTTATRSCPSPTSRRCTSTPTSRSSTAAASSSPRRARPRARAARRRRRTGGSAWCWPCSSMRRRAWPTTGTPRGRRSSRRTDRCVGRGG